MERGAREAAGGTAKGRRHHETRSEGTESEGRRRGHAWSRAHEARVTWREGHRRGHVHMARGSHGARDLGAARSRARGACLTRVEPLARRVGAAREDGHHLAAAATVDALPSVDDHLVRAHERAQPCERVAPAGGRRGGGGRHRS
eukprot:3416349-Prymnesium_polylepis.1